MTPRLYEVIKLWKKQRNTKPVPVVNKDQEFYNQLAKSAYTHASITHYELGLHL